MIRILFLVLFLFLPIHSWAASSVGGIDNPTSVSGITTPPTVAGISVDYDNIFTNDSNCKALWRFEPGALTTDSKGSNTLVNDGVDEETANHMEGTGCGHWVLANTDDMYITNANWTGPWKSTDSVKTGSVFARVSLHSVPDFGAVFSKWGDTSRSVWFGLAFNDPNINAVIYLGYNSGGSEHLATHLSSLSLNTPYYITWSYDGSSTVCAIRIRDEAGNVVGTDIEENTGHVVDVGTESIAIGAEDVGATPSSYFDGLIDEMVVFDDIITSGEATQIAKGIYR